MPFKKSFQVGWTECDANGHLRNTAYSEYGIETRVSYLAQAGFPWKRMVEHGIGPVIQREEIDYLREVHMGELVEVDFKATGSSPEGGRFLLTHDFFRADGKRVAHITIRGGWLDLKHRRLTAPPADLLRAMAGLERGEKFEELPPVKPRGP